MVSVISYGHWLLNGNEQNIFLTYHDSNYLSFKRFPVSRSMIVAVVRSLFSLCSSARILYATPTRSMIADESAVRYD